MPYFRRMSIGPTKESSPKKTSPASTVAMHSDAKDIGFVAEDVVSNATGGAGERNEKTTEPAST